MMIVRPIIRKFVLMLAIGAGLALNPAPTPAFAGDRCEDAFGKNISVPSEARLKSSALSRQELEQLATNIASLRVAGSEFSLTNSDRAVAAGGDRKGREWLPKGNEAFWEWVLWSKETSPRLHEFLSGFERVSEEQRPYLYEHLSKLSQVAAAPGTSANHAAFLKAFVRISKLYMHDATAWKRFLIQTANIQTDMKDVQTALGLQIFKFDRVFLYGLGPAVLKMPEALKAEIEKDFPKLYHLAIRNRKSFGRRNLEAFARVAFRTEEKLLATIQADPQNAAKAYREWYEKQARLFGSEFDVKDGRSTHIEFEEALKIVNAIRAAMDHHDFRDKVRAVIVGSYPNGKATAASDVDVYWDTSDKAARLHYQDNSDSLSHAVNISASYILIDKVEPFQFADRALMEGDLYDKRRETFFKNISPVFLWVTTDAISLQVHRLVGVEYGAAGRPEFAPVIESSSPIAIPALTEITYRSPPPAEPPKTEKPAGFFRNLFNRFRSK